MARRWMMIALAAVLGLAAVAAAQQRRDMTMEEYQRRLQECQRRQRAADSTRAALEQRVQQVQGQLGQVDQQVAQVNRQIMDVLQADSAAIRDYLGQLNQLEQRARGMRQLAAGQIVDARERGELDSLQAQLNRMKRNRLSVLPDAQQRITAIQRLIDEMRNVQRPMDARRDQYTVVRGDNLWNIAKKPNIYGNPYEWVKIYTANRDQIRNPNRIEPQWNLGIPRNQEPGTYWVKRGDSLRSIARELYGDPSQWTRIHRANRDVISRVGGSERIIYPHMILQVPQN